ncbi:MAG TPA: DUF3137 domain-containing protein [Candidatus Altiarchaeales archaeon]|nr:DUF3137 domain-containing protein [Candidatus Altiarchaeales archaeon]
MKTGEEFKACFERELLPELRKLEEKRKTIVKKIILLSLTIVIPLLVFAIPSTLVYLSVENEVCCFAGVFLPALIALAVWRFKFNEYRSEYVREFKREVMDKIVKFIDPNLNYHPDQGVSRQTFKSSRIFLDRVDRFSSEDMVAGRIGKTLMHFSEMHALEKHETRDSKGRRHTHYETIFRGIFFTADFNKKFKGTTIVLPDTAEGMFGSVIGKALQSKNILRPDLIKLEDPEFEKYFVVYGDDQLEARYILSTSLMARLTDFRKKTGRKIYISFNRENIMVAIPYKKNLFEPRLFKTILEYAPVEEYFKDLSLVVGIVEDLNLNTRIWTKK